jgi:hypothetical protein
MRSSVEAPSAARLRNAGGSRILRFPAAARWAAAAVAAAILVAVGLRFGGSDARAETVRVERVIDVADAPPSIDERLLALTGGFEAVAMRRPTEMR